MSPTIRVLVCGGSLYMAGLAASLGANPNVAVLRIPAGGGTTGLAQSLHELRPAAVLFDLGELPGDTAMELLQDRPGLILLGVDPSNDEVLVLSSRQERAVVSTDLLQVIDRETQGGVVSHLSPEAPGRLTTC